MEQNVQLLLDMLTYRRKAGSLTEQAFIEKYILPLNPGVHCAENGDALAYTVVTDPSSKTLFTAHTDSCHQTEGIQQIAYDPQLNLVYKDKSPDDRQCLGADDAAGMWLMLEMITAKVPGTFHFPLMEEVGGRGSAGMARLWPDFLRQFDRAIAFDRAGYSDVITHQFGGRCCSDEFAQALADQLNLQPDLEYAPSPDGVFTDTANYTGLVPECSNLSIGYNLQHGPEEYQDVEHLLRLRDAVLNVDWESLPTVRNPEIKDRWGFDQPTYGDDLKYMTRKELRAWVKSTPANEVADAIEDLLIELDASLDAAEACSTQDPDFNYEENYYERQI